MLVEVLLAVGVLAAVAVLGCLSFLLGDWLSSYSINAGCWLIALAALLLYVPLQIGYALWHGCSRRS